MVAYLTPVTTTGRRNTAVGARYEDAHPATPGRLQLLHYRY
ncbi:hypothetical protein [uncultured Streptomyces sp.]|nr:hypothetical protein [uncultured Streptomyces sp.]